MLSKTFSIDPRWFQIIFLMGLWFVHRIYSDFAQPLSTSLIYFISCTSLELLFNCLKQSRKTLHSAVITSLSLSLLLRVSHPLFAILASFIAIGGKRLIRYQGYHFFNPANLAITSMLFFFPFYTWTASGIWQRYWLGALLLIMIGFFILAKVKSLDISLAFLTSYLGFHALRLQWLGDPFELLYFRASHFSLLIFSFFMISDPKTIPQQRLGRICFAIMVAMIAVYFDAVLFTRNGLFWALTIASPSVFILNKILPGDDYQWPSKT